MLRFAHAQSLQQDGDMMHDSLKADIYQLLVRDLEPEEGSAIRRSLTDNAFRFRSNLDRLQRQLHSESFTPVIAETRKAAESYIGSAEFVARQAKDSRETVRFALYDFEQEFELVGVAMGRQTELLGREIAAMEARSAVAAERA